MTPYELKDKYYSHNPEGHYFDKETLRFFGESMKNMKVAKELVKINDYHGEEHFCYALSALQKNHPDGEKWITHYFDNQTFDYIPI